MWLCLVLEQKMLRRAFTNSYKIICKNVCTASSFVIVWCPKQNLATWIEYLHRKILFQAETLLNMLTEFELTPSKIKKRSCLADLWNICKTLRLFFFYMKHELTIETAAKTKNLQKTYFSTFFCSEIILSEILKHTIEF